MSSLDKETLHRIAIDAASRAHRAEQTAADYACSLADSLLRERVLGTTNNTLVWLLAGYLANQQLAQESRQIMRDVTRERLGQQP